MVRRGGEARSAARASRHGVATSDRAVAQGEHQPKRFWMNRAWHGLWCPRDTVTYVAVMARRLSDFFSRFQLSANYPTNIRFH